MNQTRMPTQPATEANAALALPEFDDRVTLIKPRKAWVSLGLVELWRYRDLLLQMVYRDFSARYRQSVVGPAWVVINPVITMIVFTFVFGKIAKLPSEGVPYPVFSFAGMLPWLYFSGCFSKSSESTITGGRLLTKVYFPRLILPLSKVTIGLIDFCVQFMLLLMLMAWFQITPTVNVLFVPCFLLLGMVSGLALGLWATTLVVKYRDIQQLIGYAVQMLMWLTPVAYATSSIPADWRFLYSLNPMVSVIDGFRWAMIGSPAPDWTTLAASSSVAILLLVTGMYFFRRSESTFADVI